ncbi:MAG TPA: ATP synthase F0 subunit C, partial [Macellibacteroides fermentans]|nr:ATP synthase F0 subunit C [Macellibacteroides fermentans]
IGRQPSAIGDIRTSMLIMAALVEGTALFGIVVCFLVLFQ